MQNDPLKPGYNFDAHLVSGLTPIIEGDELDFVIDRPNGMKGFIINFTSKGKEPYLPEKMLSRSKQENYCFSRQRRLIIITVKRTAFHGFTAGSILDRVLSGMNG
ncbi:hypothetical protein P4S72_20150 [Vibrio sp. PP-XX7]